MIEWDRNAVQTTTNLAENRLTKLSQKISVNCRGLALLQHRPVLNVWLTTCQDEFGKGDNLIKIRGILTLVKNTSVNWGGSLHLANTLVQNLETLYLKCAQLLLWLSSTISFNIHSSTKKGINKKPWGESCYINRGDSPDQTGWIPTPPIISNN